MKKWYLGLLVAALTLSAPAYATYKTCPDGSKVEYNKPCPEPPKPEPETPKPGDRNWWQTISNQQQQQQDQNQHQTANGGNANATGGSIKDSGNSHNTNTNVAQGGAGGSSTIKDSGNSSSTALSGSVSGANATGGSVGNTTATGGAGGSVGDTTSRSNLTVGDVGSTSSVGNVSSGSSIGDTTLNNGSNSGGNTLSNGSESVSQSNSGGNVMTGGANTASNDGSGNSSVTVDAADRSTTNYESQALVLSTIQTAAPAIVAGPAMTVVPGVCGPKVERQGERAYGTYVGLIKKSQIDLGPDHIGIVPAAEPFRYVTDSRGNTYVEGDRVDYVSYVVGVAASRGIGLGGGETGGGWGQAGVSSGSSIQRPMVRVLITPCVLAVQPPVVIPPAPPVIRARPNG